MSACLVVKALISKHFRGVSRVVTTSVCGCGSGSGGRGSTCCSSGESWANSEGDCCSCVPSTWEPKASALVAHPYYATGCELSLAATSYY